ncbi:MAG: M24 family metallopeptidase [Chlamydiota bacterium]
MEQKIHKAQELLLKEKVDGWLLYDFQKKNPLAIDFLEIAEEVHLTRRLFYWIPASGDPVKIVHATETHVVDHLPGMLKVYFQWQTLEEILQEILKGKSSIAMEYSPRNAIPSISYVDAGTLDVIREIVPKVVSSHSFLQPFLCCLTDRQRNQHLEAARILDATASVAWSFLSSRLKKGTLVTEYDVQQCMVAEIERQGCELEGLPICAVNANSSNPHYSPTRECNAPIQKGDFVLIDLWCKKKEPGAVFADISRVAVADVKPNERQEEIFSVVYKAQKRATDVLRGRCVRKEIVKGFELDRAAREVIEEAGFGSYFIHRTGHNIYTKDHGPGTHLDSIETFDDRPLLPRTCFSIEPGIYLPKEFGVRLEYDVYITEDFQVEVSGGVQEKIVTLL